MGLPTSSQDDHLHVRRGEGFPRLKQLSPAVALSSTPFILTFLLVAVLAWRTLFPLLSGGADIRVNTGSLNNRRTSNRLFRLVSTCYHAVADRAAAITFSTTIALSAVLAELIFCEISNILDPAARSVALQLTISILLISLVIVTPLLEIHSITSAAGWRLSGLKRGARVIAWTVDVLGLFAWLVAFNWIGKAALGVHSHSGPGLQQHSLERIGIIGISLMASLAGFAAVSSLWQTFGIKTRKITDTDINRKQNGLEATTDLLSTRHSRLRALELKATGNPQDPGMMARLLGSLRPNAETQEISSLRLEIAGLETMQLSLSHDMHLLQTRASAQRAAGTPLGRVCISTSYLFSLYCIYRICATSLATIRRWWLPASSFATTDPINNMLALVAKHWDPALDRSAWARQISFLLSGLMLLASFNAVLQTVLLFSRLAPARFLLGARRNAALLVAQITATYVVSSALLLRSNLPAEMGSVIEGALGAPLDVRFVERWFEGWFLVACGATTVGIWFGRKVVGSDEWEELDADVESGKLS